jgi:hypothetical protein
MEKSFLVPLIALLNKKIQLIQKILKLILNSDLLTSKKRKMLEKPWSKPEIMKYSKNYIMEKWFMLTITSKKINILLINIKELDNSKTTKCNLNSLIL